MAVGPLRGGTQAPIAPLTQKPQAETPQKALQKAIEGVLQPGQHMVMPARTGLAEFKDHFDARVKPEYDKLLKGEVQARAKSQQSDQLEQSPEARAADEAATASANDAAMAMMDLLPQIPIPPPIPMARPQQLTQASTAEEAEEQRELHQRESDPDLEAEPDEDFADPPPNIEKRAIELQAGVFTLDEGSIDVGNRRLCTLEAFLDGDVPFVSCAVDLNAIPEGAEMRIAALDAAAGKPVRLRALHQTSRTEGVGTAYFEVCVSEPEVWRAALERIVTVEVG